MAGDEESKEGCVDVRSRDGQRVGKMRIDQVAKYFEDLKPKPSRSSDHLYEKIWKPEDYPVVENPQPVAAEAKPAEEKKQE